MTEIKKILVTGGSGMVGKNILIHSKISRYQVLSPSSKDLNLLNYENTLQYCTHHKPDLIIHCAGRVGGIQANIKNPVEFLVENMDMGRNIVLASRKSGIKKLLNMGSSCMYPRSAQNPLLEEMVLTGELEPTNEGYALAKVMTQRLCSYVKKENSEFEYKTLIPCNLYGYFDKFDPAHSHLVPAILHKVHLAKLENRQEVEIWGDGTARREFMYTGDLVDFVLEACERFSDLPDLINVGLGYDYTINEYYEAAARVVGYKGKFVHDLSKPVGMKKKLVSTIRLEAFGWKAKASLEEGLMKTYEHYLNLQKN